MRKTAAAGHNRHTQLGEIPVISEWALDWGFRRGWGECLTCWRHDSSLHWFQNPTVSFNCHTLDSWHEDGSEGKAIVWKYKRKVLLRETFTKKKYGILWHITQSVCNFYDGLHFLNSLNWPSIYTASLQKFPPWQATNSAVASPCNLWFEISLFSIRINYNTVFLSSCAPHHLSTLVYSWTRLIMKCMLWRVLI